MLIARSHTTTSGFPAVCKDSNECGGANSVRLQWLRQPTSLRVKSTHRGHCHCLLGERSRPIPRPVKSQSLRSSLLTILLFMYPHMPCCACTHMRVQLRDTVHMPSLLALHGQQQHLPLGHVGNMLNDGLYTYHKETVIANFIPKLGHRIARPPPFHWTPPDSVVSHSSCRRQLINQPPNLVGGHQLRVGLVG